MTPPAGPGRRVLVLGSGAREHALARALAGAPSVAEVTVAPGNAGIGRDEDGSKDGGGRGEDGRRDAGTAGGATGAAPIRRADAPAGLAPAGIVDLARRVRADLVVVGPEAPLCAGVVDALEDARILAFGPRRSAAMLEGSKAFLKRFAARHGIPTAPFAVTASFAEAETILRKRGAPIVVKADGLCAGKGVVVASTLEEALDAARAMLVERRFGEAGATVVLEDVIPGEEVSVHAITDGERLFVLPTARDHKRIGDGDTGPNTGGMGACAPSPRLSKAMLERVTREILRPTIDGMRAEGRLFRGALFAGLMVTPEGDPILLEHNVRFGDPECEALLGLLDGDLASLLASAAFGKLHPAAMTAAPGRHAVVVVLAAHGYPAAPRTGDVIHGIEEAARVPGTAIHHAGTAERDGVLVTAGGRVLAVTSTGGSLAEARERAYAAASLIRFDGMQLRRDIGASPG